MCRSSISRCARIIADPRRSAAVACAWIITTLAPVAVPAQADPVIVEEGWVLLRSIAFDNPVSALYHPLDGQIYVGRRGADDGLFRLDAHGLAEQLASGSDLAAICAHPDSGHIYQSEDYGGVIYRTDFEATGRVSWVSGFASGDDDPVGMAIAPADHAGDVLLPGQALVVDRGYNGVDAIWLWTPSVPEGETALHPDDGTLVDAVDVAIDATDVFVADTRDGAAGTIWAVGAGGDLTALATSEPIADPAGLAFDPWNDDLLVLDHGADRVVRVARATGEVSNLATGFAMAIGWNGVDITPDGRRLLVTDLTSDVIHEFGRCGDGPGMIDCDGNGIHDACDILSGTLPDCNDNGIPDGCDIASGVSEDCDLDGTPDECPHCPPVELVFIMDTSASMDDEAAALCNDLDAVIARLEAAGVTVAPRLLGICGLPGGAYACLEDHVVALLGTVVPGEPAPEIATLGDCPGGVEVCSEDWGRATAVVAGLYPWQPEGESLRLVVPISDEGPWCGDPVTAFDHQSIVHAADIAHQAGVVVSPITGTGASQAVIDEAEIIAQATGGQRFSSSDPEEDIAANIVALVLDACTAASDCNENGHLDGCDIADGISQDVNGNGIPDECEVVGVRDLDTPSPLRLLGNQPNPFNPRTVISYALSAPDAVSIRIYDLAGSRVRTLLEAAPQPAGVQSIGWDGRDAAGRSVPAGVYLYRIEAGSTTVSGRMALIR